MDHKSISTTCCIVGGGPAGMMLGLLLARSGIDVTVLEKHVDFFRDFRGDTIHPSTLELISELGLLEDFLKCPHDEMKRVQLTLTGDVFMAADFSRLPTKCKFIAFMPQWDFLDFISAQAKKYSNFHLHMMNEVDDLIVEGDRIVGVRANTQEGSVEIRADLVIGADGRHSTVRNKAGLKIKDFGVPIDVLWSKIPKDPGFQQQSLGYIEDGYFMVLIDRTTYFQCGYIVPKGSFDKIKSEGIPEFHSKILRLAPFIGDQVKAIDDWEKVKLLTVKIDRLMKWYRPGLLCIGDSAHAMSPAGGVGINLAIQDAVATANILATKLKDRAVTIEDLAAVQKRREFPTKMTQAMQVFIHNRTFGAKRSPIKLMPILKWSLRNLKFLPGITARIMGLGFRREHVKSPKV